VTDDDLSITADFARVGIVVKGKLVSPDDMTQVSGVEASRGWRCGERYLSKSGQTLARPWGLWAVSVDGPAVEPAAKALLARLSASVTAIQEAAARAQAEVAVQIWWNPTGGQGGFDVSSETMALLCRFGSRISVYFPG
jgi:hypothetical protein